MRRKFNPDPRLFDPPVTTARDLRVRAGVKENQRKIEEENMKATGQELLDIGFAHDRTTGKEEWLTPPWILKELGEFDLDPCAPVNRPWEIAKKHFTIQDNGLIRPWEGRVFCNPPYGTQTPRWMQRMSEHQNGIALIFVRTETATFFPWIWNNATSFLFIKGRLSFYTTQGKEGGTAGAPSMLIAYSDADSDVLAQCAFKGAIPGKFLMNEQVKSQGT